jgi:hypothetical protein
VKRGNLFVLMAIAAVSVLLAWYVARTPQETVPEGGRPLVPAFLSIFSDARRVVLRSHEGTVTLLAREDGHSWQVQERFGYPADLEKLRALRDGWAGLVVVEPKTTKPEHFAALDLADLADPGSKALQLQLMDDKSAVLLDWLVGKHRFIPGGGETQEYYVRRTHEHASYLVRGNMPLETRPEQWLVPQVVSLPAERIEAAHLLDSGLTIKPRDAISVDVEGLAPGEELVSQYTLANLLETLRSLQLNDVLSAREMVSQVPLRHFELDTRDGIHIDYKIMEYKAKKYVLLKASAAPREESGSGPSPAAAGSGKQGEAHGMSVVEQIKHLNAQWEPWAFELKSYDATKLLRERKDMVRKAQQQTRR